MNTLFTSPFGPALGSTGLILPAATMTFYLTGTTTFATIYDDDGDAQANPVLADAFGRFPFIYLDPTVIYRVILKDKFGATVPGGDLDPFEDSLGPLLAPTGADLLGYLYTNVYSKLGVRKDLVNDFGAQSGVAPSTILDAIHYPARTQQTAMDDAAAYCGTDGAWLDWPLGDFQSANDFRILGNFVTVDGLHQELSRFHGIGGAKMIRGQANFGDLNKGGTKVLHVVIQNMGIKPDDQHPGACLVSEYADSSITRNCSIGPYGSNGTVNTDGLATYWTQWERVYNNEINVSRYDVVTYLQHSNFENEDHFVFRDNQFYTGKTPVSGAIPMQWAVIIDDTYGQRISGIFNVTGSANHFGGGEISGQPPAGTSVPQTAGIGTINSRVVGTFVGSIAGTVLTVASSTKVLLVGDVVTGAGVTPCVIGSYGTGTGGAGTYNVTVSQTVASETMTSTPGDFQTFYNANVESDFFENISFPVDLKRQTSGAKELSVVHLSKCEFLQARVLASGTDNSKQVVTFDNCYALQAAYIWDGVQARFGGYNKLQPLTDYSVAGGALSAHYDSLGPSSNVDGVRLWNTGTIVLPSGSASVAVAAHALSATPAIFSFDEPSSGGFWASAIGGVGAGFTLNAPASTGANRTVRWTARVVTQF